MAYELGLGDVDVPDPVLPHRFCELAGPPGIRVVDDAMAATPAKAAFGVARLARELGSVGRVVLLAGGLDAGVHRALEEERALVRACGEVRGARVVAFGEAAPRIVAELPDATVVADLEAAIAAGLELARAGRRAAAGARCSRSRWPTASGSGAGVVAGGAFGSISHSVASASIASRRLPTRRRAPGTSRGTAAWPAFSPSTKYCRSSRSARRSRRPRRSRATRRGGP